MISQSRADESLSTRTGATEEGTWAPFNDAGAGAGDINDIVLSGDLK